MILVLMLLTFLQTFEQPLHPIQVTPDEIVALIDSASETIFLVTPISSSRLEQHLVAATARGVKVYVVMLNNPGLSLPGIELRTLASISQGLLLVDKTLVVGGILSGRNEASIQMDTSLYGTVVTEQLRALWQVAKPGD